MASSTTSGLHRARAAGAIEVSEVPWSALLAHETLVTFSTFVIIQADIHATKETTFDEKVRGLVHSLVAWLRGYIVTAVASEDCCVTSVAICRHKGTKWIKCILVRSLTHHASSFRINQGPRITLLNLHSKRF